MSGRAGGGSEGLPEGALQSRSGRLFSSRGDVTVALGAEALGSVLLLSPWWRPCPSSRGLARGQRAPSQAQSLSGDPGERRVKQPGVRRKGGGRGGPALMWETVLELKRALHGALLLSAGSSG